MGVKDLSKELRPSSKLTTRLADFDGSTVGIDASIWLNKAIFSSPEIGLLPSVDLSSVTVSGLRTSCQSVF